MVLANHRDGYDFIKIYNDIDPDVFDALVATSREVGLPIVGHVTFAKGLDGALAARQDSIEHLRAYDFAADTRTPPGTARFEGWLYSTPERLAELAERTVAAGVWNCPTLVVQLKPPADGAPPPRDYAGLPPWLADMLEGLRLRQSSGIFTAAQLRALGDGEPYRMAMVAALDRAGPNF